MAENTKNTISSIDHIPAGERKNFPPFDKSTFASQLVWFAIFFIALYVIIARLAIPRIGGIGIFGMFGATLPLALVVALTALELLVAFLQAYVFAILTCIYLNDAIHPGH